EPAGDAYAGRARERVHAGAPRDGLDREAPRVAHDDAVSFGAELDGERPWRERQRGIAPLRRLERRLLRRPGPPAEPRPLARRRERTPLGDAEDAIVEARMERGFPHLGIGEIDDVIADH